VISLQHSSDSSAASAPTLELLSYNMKKQFVVHLTEGLTSLVDQQEHVNHDGHLDFLQRRALMHCHADYELDLRQQQQVRRKRRAGGEWWSALCGGA